MKIVILDGKTVFDDKVKSDYFDGMGEVTVYDLSPYETIAERIKDAEIVLCNKSLIDKHNIDMAPNLKYIGLFATGYNNIDIDYARSKGIVVCNAGSYSENAVAQHTFAFILNHFNNISKYDAYVKNGGWINSSTFSAFSFPLNEIYGKTIGIIGYGSIGKAVGEIAKSFGMRVLPYSRSIGNSLESVLSESDIVTVHCPLNKDSEKMFNAETFKMFKDGAYFINTARGGVLDEHALTDALKSGKLSGAAIDVLTVEPMDKDCPLMDAPNVTFTPHIAWAPVETRERLMGIVKGNIEAYLSGKPTNKVN